MQLHETLATKAVRELKSISEWFGLQPKKREIPSKEKFIEYLTRHMLNRIAMLYAMNKLGAVERRMILYLAAAGGELVDVELIQETMRGDRDAFRAVVGNLKDCGLVFENSEDLSQFGWHVIGIPADLRPLIPVPFVLKGSLAEYLSRLPILKLQELCRQLDISSKIIQRNYLIKKIRQQILDPVYLRRYIDELPKEESGIFQFIFDLGGRVTTESLDNHFSLSFNYKQGLRRLLDRPILIPDRFEKSRDEYMISSLRIPREIISVIRNRYYGSYHMDLSFTKAMEVSDTPKIRPLPSLDLERNLLILMGYILRVKPGTLKKGGIERRHLKKVASYLPGMRMDYVEFIHSLSELSSLISAGSKIWCVCRNCTLFLDNPIQFRTQIADNWLDSSFVHDDECRTGTAGTSQEEMDSIPEVRYMILESLADVPAGQWVTIMDIQDVVHRRFGAARKLLEPGDDPGARHSLIRVIETSLQWLGLIELGYVNGKKKVSTHLRLTDHGRYFLFGWLHDSLPDIFDRISRQGEAHPLKFRKDGSAEVPGDYSSYLLLNLLTFANLEKAYPSLVVSFDRDSIRNGFDSGLSSEQMLELLVGDSSEPLPDQVTALIQECTEQYGEITVGGGGGFIKARNGGTLKKVTGDKKYQPFIRKIITNNCAIITPQSNRDRLVELLRRDGLMPIVEDESIKKGTHEDIRIALTPHQVIFLEKIIYVLKCLAERTSDKDLQRLFRNIYERLRKPSKRIEKERGAGTVNKALIESFVKLIRGRNNSKV